MKSKKKVKTAKKAKKQAQPKQTQVRSKAARAHIAEGTRLFALAGRPTKAQFVKVYGPQGPKMTWEQFTTSFLATSSSTTLEFLNEDPLSDNSNGLDNGVVTPGSVVSTPEPSTLLLLHGSGLRPWFLSRSRTNAPRAPHVNP